MEEIKFRGISEDEWVYGLLVKANDFDTEHGEPYKYLIQTEEKVCGEYVKCFITNERSIGRYTGIKDIAGKEIYEGDIVRIAGKIVAEIAWAEEYAAYILITTEVKDAFENLGDYLDYSIEVIGNVIDNPRLLWEGK